MTNDYLFQNGAHVDTAKATRHKGPLSVNMCHPSLYIKHSKVSVRSSVTLGVASFVANDVTIKMTS